MFRHILVGLDESPGAQQAFEGAIQTVDVINEQFAKTAGVHTN